jgi:hypothetical protein
MDPFLEHPAFFPDLHGSMHVYIREALQASLPPPYFAVVKERLWVETSTRYVEPDTDVIRESYVEICTRLSEDDERIVAAIEILSLSNKTPGEKGQDAYLEKQREVLGSSVHLVEIDLLRGGEHTTPMDLGRLRQKAGPFDYHVSVHRFDQPGRFFVYAWKLDAALPEIAIPLLPGDGPVLLDLQAVFTRCYDTGPYRRRVRYDAARLVPPLDTERTAWAMGLAGNRR